MDAESGDPILLLGASVRAAALSARRAGLVPCCADRFADHDLAARFAVLRATDYPQDLERIALEAPPCPWLYTGALENHPQLLARIARQRPLWGNNHEVVRRVRDPFAVADCLARAGLHHPQIRRAGDTLPADTRWLAKPIAGSGGRAIRAIPPQPADPAIPPDPPAAGHEPYYAQEFIDGDPCACLFVANSRLATLLGFTRQLIAQPELHAAPFHYCGSVGPVPLSPRLRAACQAVGQALTTEFGLIGLFGVDCILRDGEIWPVEVNPRYTASAEIVEHAAGYPAIAWQRDACVYHRLPDPSIRHRAGQSPVLGKAILFAPDRIRVPDLSRRFDQTLEASGEWPLPAIADVPWPDAIVERGHPIMTVFALGGSVDECTRNLLSTARRFYGELDSEALAKPVAPGVQ